MVEVSDDMLMAYADGRLDALQVAAVQAALAAQPELQARLLAFEATSATSGIWRVFDAPMREPAPKHLVDFIMTHGGSSMTTEGPRVQSARPRFSETILALLHTTLAPWPRTAALATVLALGVAVGWTLHRSPAGTSGPLTTTADDQSGPRAAGVLQAALETEAAGALATVSPGDKWLAAPVLTFRTADGGYCRKYEMARASETTGFSGVACRTPQGQWLVRAHGPSAVKRGPVTAVEPAAGPTQGLIDATIEKLMDGDALGVAEDREALAARWK